MIKQHYTGSSRQAVNLIWNGAGDYDFDPPFLAFYPNGDADDYFNLIIGLTHKWLDLDRIDAFFGHLGTSNTAQEAASVLWLGIENCVYLKELPSRPILEDLRRERAKNFYTYAASLSRQQMMLQSMKVFDQEEVRWGKILGKKTGLDLSPSAKRLAGALDFSGDLDTEGLIEVMDRVCRDFFHLKGGRGTQERTQVAVWGLAGKLARALMRREIRNTDLLVVRQGSGTGDRKGAVRLAHVFGQEHTSGDPEKDRAYIEECFGSCTYSDREMRILENELCTGTDASCRLWITSVQKGRESRDAGGLSTEEKNKDKKQDGLTQKELSQDGQEKEKLSQDVGDLPGKTQERKSKESQAQAGQRARNEAYYKDHIFQIQEAIRNLTAQTDTIFSTYLRYLPKRSQRGKIHAEEAWRLPVLSDPDVFLSDSDQAEFTVTVDLLLDASQSRTNHQEEVAAQALIIARSFETCGVPVRVTAFRSLRGYTVLQVLKETGDKRGEGIFAYYAGGWNRDGLGLKTMDSLIARDRDRMGNRRILLVLTDASPNDSMQIPPDESHFLPREYEGDVAVRDAAEGVRRLRSHNIQTAAIYLGPTSHLDQVHQIYGQNYARIRSLGQFSDAVGRLLKRALEKTGPS